MRRIVLACCLIASSSMAQAWNAAGHRLVASIAWLQLSPPSREMVSQILSRHPDHPRWLERAGSKSPEAVFAEASTWADELRKDPRFYDETRDAPTPPPPGLSDSARHKHWHFVDFTADGQRHDGEIDRQIERLQNILATGRAGQEVTYALPWLLHLVADLHQPLHVGRAEDGGGNQIEIENPFNRRQPFTTLHSYWDDLPGPTSLRGERLQHLAQRLISDFPSPQLASIHQWRDESHALLDQVYPPAMGSLLPIITEEFQQQSRQLANRRLVDAGYRLGWLLETSLGERVSRETRAP